LANLPREIRDQSMALYETGMGMFGSMVSPVAAAATGVGRNIYDYFVNGKIDPKASTAAANRAAEMTSYQPVMPSAQSLLQTMGEAPAAIMGTGQGLPPIVSGINPRAVQLPRGALGSVGAGIKRDIGQFDNDIYNAQRGITPGYPTMGTEFQKAFVDPRPTISDMLTGLEPSNIPSTASAAVKPNVKGTWLYDYTEGKPFARDGSILGTVLDRASKKFDINEWEANTFAVLPEWGKDLLKDRRRAVESAMSGNYMTVQERNNLRVHGIEQFVDEYNPLAVAQGLSPLPLVRPQIEKIDAYNEWLRKPNLSYIQKQMGTGLATDPVVKAAEAKTPLVAEGTDVLQPTGSQGLDNRDLALQLRNAIPGMAEKYPDVGNLTATTDMGKAVEGIIDREISMVRKGDIDVTQEPNYAGIPEQVSPDTPIYDLSGYNQSKLSGLPEIQKYVWENLENGKFDPKKIGNVSVEQVAKLMAEDIKKTQRVSANNVKMYGDWRYKRHQELPSVTDYEDGSKMVRFDKERADADIHAFMRDVSVDTKDLNHCISKCGHSVSGAEPEYKHKYLPIVEPHTGLRPKGAPQPPKGQEYHQTDYTNGILNGSQIHYTLRAPNGQAQATIGTYPINGSYNTFKVKEIMGYNDSVIKPEFIPHVVKWLNENANQIESIARKDGLQNLKGVFDTQTDTVVDVMGISPLWESSPVRAAVNKIRNDIDAPRFMTPPMFAEYARTNGIDLLEAPRLPVNEKDAIKVLEDYRRRYTGALADKNEFATPEELQTRIDQTTTAIQQIKNNIANRTSNNAQTVQQALRPVVYGDEAFDPLSVPSNLRTVTYDLMGNTDPAARLPADVHLRAIQDLVIEGEHAGDQRFLQNKLDSIAQGVEYRDLTPEQRTNLANIYKDFAKTIKANPEFTAPYNPLPELPGHNVREEMRTYTGLASKNSDLFERLSSNPNMPELEQLRANLKARDALMEPYIMPELEKWIAQGEKAYWQDTPLPRQLWSAFTALTGEGSNSTLPPNLHSALVKTLINPDFNRQMMNALDNNKMEDLIPEFKDATSGDIFNARKIMDDYGKWRFGFDNKINKFQRDIERAEEVRRELGLRRSTGLQPMAINWSVANELRDAFINWNEVGSAAYEASPFTFSSPEISRVADILIGERNSPQAHLPEAVHWDIVRTLADPSTTHQEVRELRSKYGAGNQTLRESQKLNAIHIIKQFMDMQGIPVRTNAEHPTYGFAKGGQVKHFELGGGAKPPAARIDGERFVQAAIANDLPTDIGSLNRIVGLGNKGMTVKEAAASLSTKKMAGGGAVHMEDGGGAKKDDIMGLKKPPADTSFARVDSLLADIGKNRAEYERIAQGGTFDRKKFTPENIYAMRLLQAANATPDPERYLESLNPYHGSQLQFDLSNPNSNVLGYVNRSEPNKAVIQSMKRVDDLIPHELTHTLQWGKGLNPKIENNQQTMRRAQSLPIEMQNAMMPSGNSFQNMKEVWANVAARAHLVNAAGGDFINSPEGRALFPTNTEQRDYYTNAMPGVNSVTPSTGTFVPNNQTLLQRVVRNAKRELGLANGGKVSFAPNIDAMRRELTKAK
jgi:hypothetical protein